MDIHINKYLRRNNNCKFT